MNGCTDNYRADFGGSSTTTTTPTMTTTATTTTTTCYTLLTQAALTAAGTSGPSNRPQNAAIRRNNASQHRSSFANASVFQMMGRGATAAAVAKFRRRPVRRPQSCANSDPIIARHLCRRLRRLSPSLSLLSSRLALASPRLASLAASLSPLSGPSHHKSQKEISTALATVIVQPSLPAPAPSTAKAEHAKHARCWRTRCHRNAAAPFEGKTPRNPHPALQPIALALSISPVPSLSCPTLI
jgi:hypothetical protein